MISRRSARKTASSRSDCRALADQIKERLTDTQVVERYGFHVNYHGYIQCPFHQRDNHASLKVYSGDKSGWHCFGCGKGGSVIDFVMHLFGIDFRQALLRLDVDFGLGLTGGETTRAEQSAILEARRREEERKAALDQEYRQRAAEHQYWWEAKIHFAPAPGDRELHPLYAEALFRLQTLEYWLDENIGR